MPPLEWPELLEEHAYLIQTLSEAAHDTGALEHTRTLLGVLRADLRACTMQVADLERENRESSPKPPDSNSKLASSASRFYHRVTASIGSDKEKDRAGLSEDDKQERLLGAWIKKRTLGAQVKNLEIRTQILERQKRHHDEFQRRLADLYASLPARNKSTTREEEDAEEDARRAEFTLHDVQKTFDRYRTLVALLTQGDYALINAGHHLSSPDLSTSSGIDAAKRCAVQTSVVVNQAKRIDPAFFDHEKDAEVLRAGWLSEVFHPTSLDDQSHTRDRDRDRSRDRPALLQILKPHHTALLALIARAHKRTGEREAAVQQARGRWADARARRDALKRRLLVRWATASVGGIATLEAAAGATLDGTDAGAEADGVKQGMPLIVSVADQELEREGVVRMRNITAGLEGVIPVMVPPRSGGGGDKDKSAARLPPAPIPAAPPVLATPQPRPAPLPPSDPQGHVGQLEAKLRKSSPTSRQSPAPNVNQTQFPSNDATMRQRPLSSSFPGEATSAMGIRRPPGSLAVTDGGLAMPQPQSQQFSVSPGVSPIPTPTISPVPPQTQSQAVSGTGTIAGLVPVPSPRSQLQHVQYASIRTSGRDAATQLQPPSPPPLRPLPDPAQSMMVPDMQPSPPSSKLKHSIQPLNIQQNLRPSQPSSKSNMSADVRPLPYHASPQSIPQSVPTRAALPQQQPPPQQPPPQQPPPPLPPLKQPLPPPPSRQQQLPPPPQQPLAPPPPQQPLAPPPPSQPQGLQLNNPPSRDSYPTSREPKPSIRAASSSSSSSPSLAVHPGHISHPRTASDSSYIAMSQSQQPQSAERHPAVHGILKHTPPVVESTAAARRPSGAADTDPWAWGVKVAAATSSRPQPKLKTMFNLWRSAEGGKQQPQQQQHQGEASAESSARGGAQLPPLPESQSLSPKSRQQQNPRAATQTVRFVDGVQVIPRPAVDSDPYEDEDEDEDEEGLPPSPRRGSMIWLQDQDLDQDQEHEALTVESDEEFGGDGHEHVARGMGRDQHGGGGSVPVGHTATRSESSFSSASSSNWAEHSTTEVPSSSVSSTPSALTTSYLASYYMDVEDEEDGGDDLKDDDGTSWFSQQQRQAGIQTGEAVANDEKLKRREAGVDPSNNSLQGLYDDLHFADADSDTQHARYISQSAGSNSKVTTMAIRTAPRGSNQTQAQKATRQMSQGSAVSDHELLHSIFPSPAQSGISERDLLFSP